jgi:peptidoglycan hydrolase-like protein with peptidoglycan-binding domain
VRFFLTCFLSLMLSGAIHAQEMLPHAQRELRARKLYFGEINGRATKETAAAILRFQRSKGIDATGNLCEETLRALGYPTNRGGSRQDLEACAGVVSEYLKAREDGRWEEIKPYFAKEVDYLYDGLKSREDLRELLATENRRWPNRAYTTLNRIASLLPKNPAGAQVTVRVQTRVKDESGVERAETEDIIFRLQKAGDRWQIAALKLLE